MGLQKHMHMQQDDSFICVDPKSRNPPKSGQPSHPVTPTLPDCSTSFTVSFWKLQIKTLHQRPSDCSESLRESLLRLSKLCKCCFHSTAEQNKESVKHEYPSRLHLVTGFPRMRSCWLSGVWPPFDACTLASFSLDQVSLLIQNTRVLTKEETSTDCCRHSLWNFIHQECLFSVIISWTTDDRYRLSLSKSWCDECILSWGSTISN